MRVLRMLCCVLLLMMGVKLASAQSVLLIASSFGKGQGPYTSVIQTPLVTAGYSVRVWEQLTLGWPPIDTLRAYNCRVLSRFRAAWNRVCRFDIDGVCGRRRARRD